MTQSTDVLLVNTRAGLAALRPLFTGINDCSPSGAIENSPAIHRWDLAR